MITCLPVVERELRVAARRAGTYWLRSIIAGAVLLVATWVFVMTLNEPPRVVGQLLFHVLAGGALILSLSAGVRFTSDSLSEEKREGTLGLLFLTNLRGYDVVLGKLAANSLGAFYGLLAIVPLLALPLLMGGTAPEAFARMAVALLNSLFFSLSVGLFCSAISKVARKAAGATILILLFFTAGCPFLGAWLDYMQKTDFFIRPLLLPSPVFCHVMATDLGGARAAAWPQAYYWSLGIIHLLGWGFLWLACRIAPRAWQDRPASARRVGWQQWWRLISFGSVAESRRHRTAMLDRNPFFWLAARARWGPAQVWAALAAMTALWAWGAYEFKRDWFDAGIYVATALCANALLKVWMASEASRPLAEERRLGSLELLLTTPLSVPQIIRGHQLALLRQFAGPLIVVLAAEIVMMLAAARSMRGEDQQMWLVLWLGAMVLLVADAVALSWVGMWMGLSARNPRQAFSLTLLRVLLVPWLGFALFLMVVALREVARLGVPDEYVFVAMWIGLGLLCDAAYGLSARARLLANFRAVAVNPRRTAWWRISLSG